MITLPTLAESLASTGKTCCREVGAGLLLVGYAGHNWLFATSVEAARPMGFYGHVYVVATVEAAMEIMGMVR
jgi:hypothetical protein